MVGLPCIGLCGYVEFFLLNCGRPHQFLSITQVYSYMTHQQTYFEKLLQMVFFINTDTSKSLYLRGLGVSFDILILTLLPAANFYSSANLHTCTVPTYGM